MSRNGEQRAGGCLLVILVLGFCYLMLKAIEIAGKM